MPAFVLTDPLALIVADGLKKITSVIKQTIVQECSPDSTREMMVWIICRCMAFPKFIRQEKGCRLYMQLWIIYAFMVADNI